MIKNINNYLKKKMFISSFNKMIKTIIDYVNYHYQFLKILTLFY